MTPPKRFPPNIKPLIEVPNAVGASLTPEQIESIAQTAYSRFVHHAGLPDWKSAFAREARETMISTVKKVVDAMIINHFTIKQLGIKENERI